MLKVFTMFSGYGGAEFGLKKAEVPHEVVGYSEIDKYAIQCYDQNHTHFEKPHKVSIPFKNYNFGDATKIDPEKLPDFDLLTGGFPCQSFSITGKRKGFEDTRGTLFFDIARILKVKQPKHVVLENVKGLLSHDNGNTFRTIIWTLESLGYGVMYKVLNSKEHGIPQNRERIWIVCKLGGWDFMEFQFPEKEKLKIFVKDILEENVPKKYYLSKKAIEKIKKSNFGKKPITKDSSHTSCLTSGYHKIPSDGIYVADFRNDEGLRIRKDNCSPCLAASKNSETDISKQILIFQTAHTKANGKRYKDDGCSFTLEAVGSSSQVISGEWRRLTPTECFKLMGFEDNEINLDGLSNTQKYKLAGNGWDVSLVSKLFKKLYGGSNGK